MTPAGGPRHRTPPETISEITTRYKAGDTIPTIARDLDVSTDTVRRHLRVARVPLRDDRTGAGPQALTDRVHATGTTTRTIRAWAKAAGLTVPAKGQVPAHIIDAYQAAHPQEGTTP